jgi:hypothetical protein
MEPGLPIIPAQSTVRDKLAQKVRGQPGKRGSLGLESLNKWK